MDCPETKRGQIALITLLLLSVVLVVVLSVVSRSVEDVGLSSRDDQSSRALSAAEAGIEAFLASGGTNTNQQFGNGSLFNASISDYAGGTTDYLYPRQLVSGDTATFWFVEHDSDNNLTCGEEATCSAPTSVNVCWYDASATYSKEPAIEAYLFYDTSGNAINGDYSGVEVSTEAFDQNAARRNYNNFSTEDGGCSAFSELSYRGNFNISSIAPSCVGSPGCVLAMVVRMLYTDTPSQIGMTSSDALPAQAKLVESIGKSGDATRKLEVIQPFAELPPVFMAAMFSQGEIIK